MAESPEITATEVNERYQSFVKKLNRIGNREMNLELRSTHRGETYTIAAAVETQLLSDSDVTDPGEIRRMLTLLIPMLYYHHVLSPENVLELLPSFKKAVE